ncbi:MAG: LPXTG cell wall anchor domain-containing protein, partial [Granulicatella sp.]|nr:LPXTG cell wall anchor domain-containing protein [Granulicatella sp.]
PTNATFVKNVFEVNVDFKLGDKSTDYYYPSEDNDANQPEKTYLAYSFGYFGTKYNDEDTRYQYGLGQLYKEYEKDGVLYRIAAPTTYDEHASVSAPIYSEIHYYNLYQPTRAYHVSDQLTNVKNIYAKEETETTENKGRVIVKYELADGTSIKETADVVKDSVISSTEAKYYLDKGNNKVIVGTPTTTNKEVLYDATRVKLPEITKDGKKYKLVGLKEGSSAEKGNVGSGTTEITYVYTLAPGGNVFAKYMLEGTTTEIAEGKALKQDASIGEEYTSVAPKVGTLLQKDGRTYFYKGHRATSAPEIGTVDENEKTVIYDFVEYSSEKGEPEVQPELPEGIVSEKGEPEVQPALPEGVVSEKGEPAIHPVTPLLITRHIIIGSNEELVPTEVGHFGPKQGMITKDSKQYQYVSTHEEDGITTHYYKEMTSESHTNVPEGNGTPSSPSVEVEQSSEETIVSQQETTQNNTEEIHLNELPKTGQVELLPTWLGFLSLIGGVFVKRKNNKDNF